jgi:hypothetical protein
MTAAVYERWKSSKFDAHRAPLQTTIGVSGLTQWKYINKTLQ